MADAQDARGQRMLIGLMLIGSVLCGLGTRPAVGAVRFCAARIEAVADDKTSEASARRTALERWRAEARVLGEAFTRWELASNRSIVCGRSAGGIRCRAGAAPCSIAQNPSRIPDAVKPPEPAVPPFPPPRRKLDI